MAAVVNAVTELSDQEYSLDVTLSDNRVIHNVMVDKDLRDRLEQGDPLAFQALQLAAETSEMIEASNFTEVETASSPIEKREKSTPSSDGVHVYKEKSAEKWKRGWCLSAEKALLQIFIECRHDDKNKWDNVSRLFLERTNIHKNKFECRSKVKTMRERYMKQKRHNAIPGNLMLNIDPLAEEAFTDEEETINAVKESNDESAVNDTQQVGTTGTRESNDESAVNETQQVGTTGTRVKWMQSIAGENEDFFDSSSLLDDGPEDEEKMQKGYWSRASEQALLLAYVAYRDHAKQKWRKVALRYNRRANIKKRPEACRLKIKSLRDRYFRLKKRNNTPGRRHIDIEDYVEEVFSLETEPSTNFSSLQEGTEETSTLQNEESPQRNKRAKGTTRRAKKVCRSVAQTPLGFKRRKQAPVESDSDNAEADDSLCNIYSDNEDLHSSGGMDKLISFLREQEKRRNLASQRRHVETMAVMKELVAALRETGSCR